MKGFLSAITKESGTGLLLLVIVLLGVWFGGEALNWDKRLRIFISIGVLGFFLVLVLIQKALAVRSALLIEKRLKAQAQEQIQSVRPDQRPELQAVHQQLEEAIAALKNSRLGKGALYAMPWYIIIGPPGSGKSTALQESGLNFPYVSQGRKGVRGVGGTRNCDWWFTDEGILLDTAGRYTTELDDHQEWVGFLDLLRKARKHKPINGAIVAVSVSDLLGAREEEVQAHAKNIRDRLDELVRQLELVFPVYLLFTKCDLVQGFVEFFEDFSRQDRSQVWGCTLPYAPAAGKPYREIFDEECRRLYRALSNQRLSTLASERPQGKKQNSYVFPLQFSMATRRLGDFVEALFRPNPFQESSIFRGFYFTSGTQEGTPIDQVIRSMSAAFGLKEESAPPAAPQDKKSYFINHLFTKLIFPDQTLARTSVRVRKRQRLLYFATLGGSALATVVLFVAFVMSFFGNRGVLGAAEAAAVKVKETAAAPPQATLEALEGLRPEVEELDRADRHGAPLGRRWGLYRGGNINSAVRRVYFDALKRLFLLPCADRLHKDLEDLYLKGTSSADFELLKQIHFVYQVLGGRLSGERDRELMEAILTQGGRWQAGFGGQASPHTLSQLRFFLSQLDRSEEWRVPVDLVLVKQIEVYLRGGQSTIRAYNEVVQDGARLLGNIALDPFWPAASKELVNLGAPFSQVFTQRGWNEYVKNSIRSHSENLKSELEKLKIPKTIDEIEADLRQIHKDRYARTWEEFVKGVQILPFQNLKDAASRLKVLAGEQSPLKAFYRSLWEGQVLRMNDGDPKLPIEPKPLESAINVLYELQQAVEEFVGSSPPGSRIMPSVKENKLDPFLAAFKTADRKIKDAFREAPPQHQEGLRILFLQVIDNTRQGLVREAQGEVDALWGQTVYKMWKETIQGKYPFAEESPTAASMADVSALLNGKSGLFWQKHQDLQSLYSHNLDGKPLFAFSREYLSAAKKAEAISQGLYRGKVEKLTVPFKITLKQREGVIRVLFTLGNREVKHDERPDGRFDFTWSETEPSNAKISVIVGGKDDDTPIRFKDDWALLRLVSAGSPKPVGEDSFACSWKIPVDRLGTTAIFYADAVIEALDKVNPFQKDFFLKFEVPDKVGP